MSHTWFRFLCPRARSQSGLRSKLCLSNNSKTIEANLRKLHRKIEHYDKVFHAQELCSYAQGQGSLAVFKVTARDQGHYKGPSGAFVTYCNISCFFIDFQGGEPTSWPHANNGKYLQYQKKIICNQIRKSATSPVLQGRFQCYKKQLAHINVIDLK